MARELNGRGVTGHELSTLEDAWLPLLEPFPWNEAQAEGLKLRGRLLFGIGARLLDGDPLLAEAAGEVWSLEDGAKHCSDSASRKALLDEAKPLFARMPAKVPPRLRPLTVLAALSAADIRSAGRLGRGAAAVRHRLTGRFPR